jgi:hypothetical protein
LIGQVSRHCWNEVGVDSSLTQYSHLHLAPFIFPSLCFRFGDSPGSYWRIELEDGLKDPTLVWHVVFVFIACE